MTNHIIPVFQGLESYDHAETLISALDLFDEPPGYGVGVSWHTMKSRRLTPKFVNDLSKQHRVLLDAGVVNQSLSPSDALELQDEYLGFADECTDVLYVIGFDHASLNSLDRKSCSDETKFVPVVSASADPVYEFDLMLADGQAAISFEENTRLVPVLAKHRSAFSLALGMPDLVTAAKYGFSAAMSNAWLTPGKFGELIFWDGSRLHRVDSSEKPKMLKRYWSAIDRTGVDMDLISANDSKELIRLAAHAYLSLGAALSASTGSALLSDDSSSSIEEVSAISSAVSTKGVPLTAVKRRVPVPLPVLDEHVEEALEEAEDGSMSMRKRRSTRLASGTVRVCDSCFLARQCPAYDAGSECAFTMPIEVRTDEQVKALLHSMVELQATRVAFARFAEEVNGGLPDPVVGQEIDRLVKITDRVRQSDERRERLTLSVESETKGDIPIGGGVLSKIFGSRIVGPQPSIDQAMSTVLNGEIVDNEG